MPINNLPDSILEHATSNSLEQLADGEDCLPLLHFIAEQPAALGQDGVLVIERVAGNLTSGNHYRPEHREAIVGALKRAYSNTFAVLDR